MILITGGAGYIGSHCAVNFIENAVDDILIFDNLSTGHIETIEKLREIDRNVKFIKGDLKNKDDIDSVFKNYKIDCVIHFAAFSIVSESMTNPSIYYKNNVLGTLNLLDSMVENKVLKIVFSSTAAVYGEPDYTPIDEDHSKSPENTYGKTKLIIENIMDDYDRAYNLKSIKLRYFNAFGADKEARFGEWHKVETHLCPNIIKAGIKGETFKIFGDDYNTKDKTAIRDYVDVESLAEAHRLAYLYLKEKNTSNVFNLGSQKGFSIYEILKAVNKVLAKEVKYEVYPKRQGDPEVLIADIKKANEILHWKNEFSVEDSIRKAFNWHKKQKL